MKRRFKDDELFIGVDKHQQLQDFVNQGAIASNVNTRLDSADTIFLVEELTDVVEEVYKVDYGFLSNQQYIPQVIRRTPADILSLPIHDWKGKAQKSKRPTNNPPLVNISENDVRLDVYTWESAARFDAVTMAQVGLKQNTFDLERESLDATRRVWEYAREDMAWVGDDTTRGMFYYIQTGKNRATEYVLPDSLANPGNIDFASKDNEQVAQEILAFVDYAKTTKQRNDLVQNGQLLLGTSLKIELEARTWNNSGTSDLSILDYVQKKRPNISIGDIPELDAVKLGASETKACMLFYPKRTDVIASYTTQEYTVAPMFTQGFVMQVNTMGRYAGVGLREKLGLIFAKGTKV